MVACLIAIVALLFVTTRRSKTTADYFCNRCGIRLWVTTDQPLHSSAPAQEQRTLEQTGLSRWFTAHLSTNCEHAWNTNHVSTLVYVSLAGHRLWKDFGASGSWTTPPLIYLGSNDSAHLEAVLKESPEACRLFIHERLQLKPETDD